jgi:transketolase
MLGLATGLAEAGFIPFVYSIATFATLRPYEFIRNGPLLHRLPVRIVGVGGGFEYGTAGPTHHALEDVGVMRVQPGLTVIAPADFAQTRAALSGTWDLPGPVYYRLGKDEKNIVRGLEGRFTLGRAQTVREGDGPHMIAMGSIAVEAAAAVDALAAEGVECGFTVIASVAPPPTDDLTAILVSAPVVITVEAHYTTGGLGSLVSEVVAERGLGTRVVRRAVARPPTGRSGNEEYMHRLHGLDRAALADAVRAAARTSAVR